MRAKRIFILLIGLLVSTSFLYAGKKNQYWVLDHVEFKGNPWINYPEGDWTVSQNNASSPYVSFSWQDPPSTIVLGEEGKIKIPCSGQCWNTKVSYGFWGNVRIPRLDRGISVFLHDGFMVPDQSNSGFEKLDLASGEELDINLWPFYLDDDLNKNCKAITYVYTLVGDVKDVVTPASPKSGEIDGPEIPWGFIVVGGLAVAGGAIAISKGGKKNNPKGQKKDNKNKKEEDEEKKQSTYRMILYKDFGDTLVANEPPKTISARIEEITPEGRKIERNDLTSKIQITAEQNCTVSNVRTEGKYKSADVVATEEPELNELGEAKVRMVFIGPGGALVNHVVFKVMGAPKIVMEEALTFEAEGGATQYIEFGINNFKGVVEGVKVTIDGDGGKYFTSKLVPDEKIPRKFRINLTEKGKPEVTVPNPSAEEHKRLPGDAERYTCTVTANLEGKKEPVKASFDIYRMYLGVRLTVNALKGYLVDYDSTYKKETLATNPKGRKKWGESRATIKLYAADKDTGAVNSVVPDEVLVFSFEDVEEGSLIFVDREGNKVTNLCSLMNFKFEAQNVEDDNAVAGVIHSGGGGLLPPNRAKAKVTVKASYQGKSYETSEIVSIISQPYRYINDEVAYSQALKEDERKVNQMIDLRAKILTDPKFAELMPFYYKVDALVESYDPKFGIYEPDYEKLMRIFKKYCSGEIGSYFVNDSVWKPEWSEADENFNAFMATFGSMEKSFVGIAGRIALGYFTAGASELVFAPYSGLVQMQKYYAKGGDSAMKGFAIACADVLFWEGVFYVGGKGIEYAKKNGLGQKLKEGFVKIKKAVEEAKKAKEPAKQLGKSKGFSTQVLGEKVAEAGKKTLKTKSTAASNASEAIRKTRQMGDAAFTGRSKLMEECAVEARKDAQKILDNFKKVMNNPTATEEEIRRATLALQGNKSAQDLLKMSQSDLLRANFNSQMQKIYKEVDDITIKKLAKKLGVDPKDVKPWNEATGNAGSDLYTGRKIGADRDVTYQVRGKDGQWVDIQEDIMEQAYCEAFNEYHYGHMPADSEQAMKTLKKLDQAVVNGETGLESYGKDLENIIKPELQAAKLYNPERVAKTFEHKCLEFINKGNLIKDEADQLMKMGLEEEAKHVMGYGEKLIEEGIRQNVKQFKRILDPRIQALAAKGVKGKDYSVLYEKIKVLESIGIPPPKDVLSATLEEVRLTLHYQYNTTVEEVVKECSNVIKEVNALLP